MATRDEGAVHLSPSERWEKQLAFIREIDRVKSIFRRSYLLDKSRHDNDAEHSWHFALMALLLVEHASQTVDVGKVVKMALVHDIVEIDAGDVLVYDIADPQARHAQERTAAERIFGLLPADQARQLIDLWEEFERRETPEAIFAAALDRLDPLLHNCFTQGKAWQENGVTDDKVLELNRRIGLAAPLVWEKARSLILDCVEKGYLKKGAPKDES
jgi:putative hydrolase of HD superfamily